RTGDIPRESQPRRAADGSRVTRTGVLRHATSGQPDRVPLSPYKSAVQRDEANLVFQMLSKRYEKGSTLLTSNKSFSEWGQVFGDDVLATAIIDRLLHHCEILAINGASYRLKNRLTAIEGGITAVS
ncbi:ATP-binding protein, partial [Streptomyces sp. BE133]|uniref:ATP-binding protein n=1 Tax=Streptomyces sp. BE133 TaxID=3002523 RepID=UPI002E793954